MSHRITTKTQITDKVLAEAALTKAGWSYTSEGGSIHVTSGPLRRASINLASGNIVGDTDLHNSDTLCALNQFYGEALAEKQIAEYGGYVESRTETEDEIILVANVSFA
jgi:hypothetical protein